MKCDSTHGLKISINHVSPLLESAEKIDHKESSVERTKSGGYVAWPGKRSPVSIFSNGNGRQSEKKQGFVALPQTG